MSRLVPPAEPVARFLRAVGSLGPIPDRLGVAVSGGPDSLALLLLAQAALPGRVHAATVDHGLRAESAAEALLVTDICARLGCAHEVLRVSVPDGPAGVQGEARTTRYAALADWAARAGIAHVATAHHADDQAETLLMRLQRGSGVGGLSGIRPVRREGGILLLRPLLDWTKAELVHLVSGAGIDAVDDPSNRDPRFDRSAMRAFLRDQSRFDPRRLARTAAALREANDAIEWHVDRLFAQRCTVENGNATIVPNGLPREIRRRLLARTIADLRRDCGIDPPWTGSEDVEGLLSTLEAGGTATLAGIVGSGGESWQLRKAPPRRT